MAISESSNDATTAGVTATNTAGGDGVLNTGYRGVVGRLGRSRIGAAAVAAMAIAAALSVSPAAAADAGWHTRGPLTEGVIVWTHREDSGVEHLLIARADGTRQRVLTPAIEGNGDIEAQVSPDGRWVAYEHDMPGRDTIHLVRPNGQGDHLLDVGCVDPCGGTDAPTWLSDHRIAYHRAIGPLDDQDNAASAVLWAVNLDGSHSRRLSEPGIDGLFEDRYARLSADRSYLTFQRLRLADSSHALFRMNLDGSHLRQLTPWDINADLYDLSTARRGPTKDLIVFQSVGRGDQDATFADIGFLPATCATLVDCTSKIVWMTDNKASGRRTSNPQWSPDGSSLVFVDRPSVNDPNAEIWTMRFGGTEPERRNISQSVNFDYRPTWGATAG